MFSEALICAVWLWIFYKSWCILGIFSTALYCIFPNTAWVHASCFLTFFNSDVLGLWIFSTMKSSVNFQCSMAPAFFMSGAVLDEFKCLVNIRSIWVAWQNMVKGIKTHHICCHSLTQLIKLKGWMKTAGLTERMAWGTPMTVGNYTPAPKHHRQIQCKARDQSEGSWTPQGADFNQALGVITLQGMHIQNQLPAEEDGKKQWPAQESPQGS